MSYILDAIKKSDQQRDLGTAPSVHTLHEPPILEEPPRRPGWLYGLAAILLLNAGGIGFWLWSGTPQKTPIAQAPAASVVAKVATQPSPTPPPPATSVASPPPQPAQVANAPTAAANQSPFVLADPPKPPSLATPPPPTPAATPVATTDNASSAAGANAPKTPTPPPVRTVAPPFPGNAAPVITPPAKSAAIPASPKKSANAPNVASPTAKAPALAMIPIQTSTPPDSVEEEPLGEIEPSPTADAESGMEVTPEDTILSPIAASAAPKRNSKKAAKDEEDPELSNIPLLNKLPAEIQQGLPELHISFHSYSIKSSARLVSISGKILREGDSFDKDVKLETITAKGVIMKAKDRRFQIKVNPSSRL